MPSHGEPPTFDSLIGGGGFYILWCGTTYFAIIIRSSLNTARVSNGIKMNSILYVSSYTPQIITYKHFKSEEKKIEIIGGIFYSHIVSDKSKTNRRGLS